MSEISPRQNSLALDALNYLFPELYAAGGKMCRENHSLEVNYPDRSKVTVHYGGHDATQAAYHGLFLEEVPHNGTPLPAVPEALSPAVQFCEDRGYTVVRSIDDGKIDFMPKLSMYAGNMIIFHREGVYIAVGWWGNYRKPD